MITAMFRAKSRVTGAHGPRKPPPLTWEETRPGLGPHSSGGKRFPGVDLACWPVTWQPF